jgi:hypothetical protein
MKLVTWNLARGGSDDAWAHLQGLDADIAFVQEAREQRLPKAAVWSGPARRENGTPQPWGSAIVAKEPVALTKRALATPARPWVADWLASVGGAVIAAELKSKHGPVVLLSCHSPAWALPTPPPALAEEQLQTVRLRTIKKEKIFAADLIWAVLEDLQREGRQVIAAGDFNLCVAFDKTFGSGNVEYIDRMKASGFTDAIRHFKSHEEYTPTFQHNLRTDPEHQLDYVWVSPGLKPHLNDLQIGDRKLTDGKVSDHLPVTVEIDL